MIQINISMKQKLTHRHREQTCGCQGGGGVRGGKEWEFGISRGKLSFNRFLRHASLLSGALGI